MQYPFLVLVVIFNCFCAKSQLTVNAGLDTLFCGHTSDRIIGGFPTASGGTPPYTYSWSTREESSPFVLHASDILDDTTLANPRLNELPSDIKQLWFRLAVRDASGLESFDSVFVRWSQWVAVTANCFQLLSPGDSYTLFLGGHSNFGGQLNVQWTPPDYLSNSNVANPVATPPISYSWAATYTDSVGCPGGWSCEVVVGSVGLEEFKQPYHNVFPNPSQGFITVEVADDFVRGRLELINSDGRLAYSQDLIEKSTYIANLDIPMGHYSLILISNSGKKSQSKLQIVGQE